MRQFLVTVLILCGMPAAFGAGSYRLLGKAVDASPAGDLAGATGIAAWDAAAVSRDVAGMAAVKAQGGRAVGTLGAAPARLSLRWPEPGADLDLGFNDFLDLDLQLPKDFSGRVYLEFATDDALEDSAMERVDVPSAPLAGDGRQARYRLDLGLVPQWRGFLRRLVLVIDPDSSSRGLPLAVGALLVGDLAGDTPIRRTDLNMKPGMKVSDLKFMESKHGCIWWTAEHEAEGFDPQVMPRRSLRMVEESWQVFVNLLGYRDPCLGMNPDNTKREKINHTTWHSGFWMGGDRDFPYFNVSEGGLRDEGWGNPVPHEFAHCVQAAQVNFLRGCHWESHANYLRFHRNYHFREVIGADTMPFETLLRASYYQDHPRLIYADYRPYFYLDSDPDQFGFEPGLVAKLWQTGRKDELFWDRLPTVLPDGVTRETVAAGIARSWITFDFVGGEAHRSAYFSGGPQGELRRFRAETPLVAVPDRPQWWAVPHAAAPMKFGWCVHELEPTADEVHAKLEGVDIAGDGESWRWGFVAFDSDGDAATSAIFEPGVGTFRLPKNTVRLAMFVVATPADATLDYARPSPENAADRHPDHRRYPYEMTLKGAQPMKYHLKVSAGNGAKHRNGGGFVASTAKVDPGAYIGPNASVLDSANVLGNARILDDAVVMGAATVRDQAEVSGGAVVSGRALVADQARVRGFAYLAGEPKVRERGRVGDFADLQMASDVHGDAVVRGMAQPLERGKIGGHAILDVDYSMAFDVTDGVHHHHVPWGAWYFDEFAAKLTKPRGLLASYDFSEADGGQALDEFGSLHALLRGSPTREKGAMLGLNGKDQYVVVDASVIDAPAATWLFEASCTGRGTQPFFAVNDLSEDGILVGVGDIGRLAAVLKTGGSPVLTLTSKTPVARGAELRVGLRLDGKTASLFQNGVKVAEQPWPHSPQDLFREAAADRPTTVYLGRDASDRFLTGRFKSFRAFNVALGDDEISKQP